MPHFRSAIGTLVAVVHHLWGTRRAGRSVRRPERSGRSRYSRLCARPGAAAGSKRSRSSPNPGNRRTNAAMRYQIILAPGYPPDNGCRTIAIYIQILALSTRCGDGCLDRVHPFCYCDIVHGMGSPIASIRLSGGFLDRRRSMPRSRRRDKQDGLAGAPRPAVRPIRCT